MIDLLIGKGQLIDLKINHRGNHECGGYLEIDVGRVIFILRYKVTQFKTNIKIKVRGALCENYTHFAIRGNF